jgi:hypothetical protein
MERVQGGSNWSSGAESRRLAGDKGEASCDCYRVKGLVAMSVGLCDARMRTSGTFNVTSPKTATPSAGGSRVRRIPCCQRALACRAKHAPALSASGASLRGISASPPRRAPPGSALSKCWLACSGSANVEEVRRGCLSGRAATLEEARGCCLHARKGRRLPPALRDKSSSRLAVERIVGVYAVGVAGAHQKGARQAQSGRGPFTRYGPCDVADGEGQFGGPAAAAASIRLLTGLLVGLQELGESRPRSGTSPRLRLSLFWGCARFSMAAAIDCDRQSLWAVSPRRCVGGESSRKGRCCRAIWAVSRARPVAGRLSDGGRGGGAWVRRAPLRSCCGCRVLSS